MVWVFVILAVALIVVVVAVVRARGAGGADARAREALRKKDYETAIELLREINNRHPGAENRYRLAEAYVHAGRYPFAIVEFKQLARSDQISRRIRAGALEQLALCHGAMRQTAEAIQAYARAIAFSPDSHALKVALAEVYIESGDYDRASSILTQLVEKAGPRADYLYRLGIVNARQGRPEDAAACLRKALEANPRFVEPHYELGLILEKSGRHDAAIVEYNKAMKLKSLRLESFLGIARCRLATGNRVDAVNTLEQASYGIEIENQPTALEIRYLLASCYEASNNLAAAVEQWRAIAEVQANYKDVVGKLRANARYAKDRLLDYEISNEAGFLRAVRGIAQILGYTPLQVRGMSNEEVNVTASNDRTGEDALLVFYRATPIGEKRVAHVFDLKESSGIREALIVSSSPVTANAKRFASTRDIRIIGKARLAPLLRAHERKAQM